MLMFSAVSEVATSGCTFSEEASGTKRAAEKPNNLMKLNRWEKSMDSELGEVIIALISGIEVSLLTS